MHIPDTQPERPVPPRPVIITRDTRLRDQITLLAGEADLRLAATGDLSAALDRSSLPPAVLVGADVADLALGIEGDVLAPPHVRHRATVLVAKPDTPHDQLAAAMAGPWPVLSAAEAIAILTRTPGPLARSGQRVVSVIGGSGGIGTSVTAAALAACGARRWGQALLVDLDRLSGGIDRRLGIATEPGWRWPQLRTPSRPPDWLDRLPTRAGVAVLSEHMADPTVHTRGILRGIIRRARTSIPLVVSDLGRDLSGAIRPAVNDADLVLLISADDDLDASTATRHALNRPVIHVATRERRGDLPAAAVAEQLQGRNAGPLLTDPAAQRRPLDLPTLPLGPIGDLCNHILDQLPQ